MLNRFFLAMIFLILVMVLISSTVLYVSFFVYVPPGKMLITMSNNGDPLPSDRILAKPGEKGIMEEVLGEGLHFVMPYFYSTEIHPLVEIPAGKIGVVISQVGKLPPTETPVVADDEKGVRRRVLPPGRYRLNPYGYKITLYDAVEIEPGFVGCVTSLVGKEPKGEFAGEGEKGVRKNVLQPGLYYLNPYEFKVQPVEVGINQVTFLDANEIRFPSKDAFDIRVEATVEWELLPEHVSQVLNAFGGKAAIEEKVIVPQSKSIGRLQGSSYGAKEFLLGTEREKFQQTFTQELERICEAKNIAIHSAFIRHLTIPDGLLLPIRESFIAVEKEKTAKFWENTKKSAADLEREKALILQRRTEVEAQTKALINTVIAETDQQVGKIEAEIRLEIASAQQEIANIEASKTVMLGEANASVTRMKGEAVSKGIEAKIKAFGDNPKAYVNYSFARKIPEDLNLKLIYSGAGTLWTDLANTVGLGNLPGMKLLKQTEGE